jgi:hypothetical protein
MIEDGEEYRAVIRLLYSRGTVTEKESQRVEEK